MTEEIWKPAPGYPLYLVSNKGRVASIMQTRTGNTGRSLVNFTVGDTKGHKGTGRLPKKAELLHRIILEAFVGPPPSDDACGLHWDDDITNNHLENLRCGTKSDNGHDAVRNGRHRWSK
jgi:hypothetical protein